MASHVLPSDSQNGEVLPMKTISKVSIWLRTGALIGISGSFLFLSAQSTKTPPASAPDNTKTNKTDSAKPTADQQKQDKADLQTTQKIRQLIEKDKSLSTYAKNIKIVTQDGTVTLSGPVRTDADKKSIEAKAVEVAGKDHVKNEIQIAATETTNPKK